MKAVTLWPEWAWAILHLDKRHENRGWQPPEQLHGERLALHAGKTIGGGEQKPPEAFEAVLGMAERAGWDVDARADGSYRFAKGNREVVLGSLSEIVTGSIVGTVVLAGAPLPGVRVAWGVPGQWAWPMRDVRALRHPIPHRGALGLWQVPDAVAGVVLSAAASSCPDPSTPKPQEAP